MLRYLSGIKYFIVFSLILKYKVLSQEPGKFMFYVSNLWINFHVSPNTLRYTKTKLSVTDFF